MTESEITRRQPAYGTSTPPSPFPRPRDWLLLGGLLCLLLGWSLGGRGLNEPDEGRYANIALAMAQPGGDWWEPRMSGYGHYDKPPLIYWATAASFRLLGLNEWAARLPSFAGALLALGGLAWTAGRLYGARTAWWAVLIAGTCVQFWAFGRILSPDMLLTGWCTLAVGAWAEGRQKAQRLHHREAEGAKIEREVGRRWSEGGADAAAARGIWGWWGASLGCWTLAWWTKATPALIPLLGLAVGVWVTRDRSGTRALKLGLLLPGVLLLGSPWYLSMLGRYPELRSFFFGRELAGRLAGRIDGRHGPVWYYVPVSLMAWLPWWPVAAWCAVRERRPSQPVDWRENLAAWNHRLGVDGWIVTAGLTVLSLAGSKLASYTLPLAPWAALLMARALTRGAAGTVDREAIRTVPAAMFAVLAMIGSTVVPDRRESRMGVNSSLRQASQFLRQHGATRVDSDHYWPGLEFYLGEDTVHYLVNADDTTRESADGSKEAALKVERHQERASDPGVPPVRFVDSEEWPALPNTTQATPQGGWWFIRFYQRAKPRFDTLLQNEDPSRRPVKVIRIGEFDLYRMPDNL